MVLNPCHLFIFIRKFGSTMLALNLTKEVSQNNGLLTSSKSYIPIRTMEAETRDRMYSTMFSSECNYITKLHLENKEIDVISVYHDYDISSNKKTVYMNTDLVNFSFNETGEYKINYNTGSESNLASALIYNDVENILSKYKNIINDWKLMFNEEPSIEDIAEITSEFRVSTSKIPTSYEIHDGIILSKQSKSGGDACSRSSYFSKKCETAYGCLTIHCDGFTTCKAADNEQEFNALINNGKCPIGVSSFNGD